MFSLLCVTGINNHWFEWTSSGSDCPIHQTVIMLLSTGVLNICFLQWAYALYWCSSTINLQASEKQPQISRKDQTAKHYQCTKRTETPVLFDAHDTYFAVTSLVTYRRSLQEGCTSPVARLNGWPLTTQLFFSLQLKLKELRIPLYSTWKEEYTNRRNSVSPKISNSPGLYLHRSYVESNHRLRRTTSFAYILYYILRDTEGRVH